MASFKEQFIDLPQGWLYEYSPDQSTNRRIAFLPKDVLHPAMNKGFTMTGANKIVLDSVKDQLLFPNAVSIGLDRERLAPPQSVGNPTTEVIKNLVTKPELIFKFDRNIGRMRSSTNTNYVFMVHLVEGLDKAYRERWQEKLGCDMTPDAKIIGTVWVPEDGQTGLPEGFNDRYEEILYIR